jgi:hypothetical protein
MLRWFLRRQIDAFEKDFGYDASYLREMADVSPRALIRFSRVMALSAHNEDAPREAWYAAKLAATMHEDCGPCTQLVVDMADRAGVRSTVLRAILSRKPESMPADAALAFRFAEATLAHDLAADALRDEIVKRWGKRALVTLALAITSSRMYPTLKYALGHGRACARVRVGGTDLPVPA